MPVVDSEILELTLAGIKTEVDAAYVLANPMARWPLIATEMPTTLPTQNYAWLGRGAVMKQWKDRAIAQGVFQATMALSDLTWVAELDIDRQTLEDDQYGLLMKRAAELGSEPVRHWDELAYQGLANGFTSICSDGADFFSASHSQSNSGTQSNITSSPLSDQALQTAEQTMGSLLDDQGKPLGVKPNVLVVGPAKSRLAADLTDSDVVVHVPGDGSVSTGATAYTPYSNYFKGRYRVVVSEYLINGAAGNFANNWFLLDSSRAVKPLIMQSRSDVPITYETDLLEPAARMKGEFKFQIRGRYVQGYGLWQLAYGSNATS